MSFLSFPRSRRPRNPLSATDQGPPGAEFAWKFQTCRFWGWWPREPLRKAKERCMHRPSEGPDMGFPQPSRTSQLPLCSAFSVTPAQSWNPRISMSISNALSRLVPFQGTLARPNGLCRGIRRDGGASVGQCQQGSRIKAGDIYENVNMCV